MSEKIVDTREDEFGGDRWYERANCKYEDASIFFVNYDKVSMALAKAICRTCPVAKECLSEAMSAERKRRDRHGIWGGLSPAEREKLAHLTGRRQPLDLEAVIGVATKPVFRYGKK